MMKLTKEPVLPLVEEERSMVSTMRIQQWKWSGHTMRNDSLLRTITEAEWKEGRQEKHLDKCCWTRK